MVAPDPSRFSYLLRKYQEDESSEEECAELFRMVGTGQYDHLISDSLYELFSDKTPKSLSKERADAILRSILPQKPDRKLVSLRSRRVWMAAAVISLLALSTWVLLDRTSALLPEVEERIVSGPLVFKGRQFVRLPDGSMVILNEASELSYTAAFGVGDRNVVLKGEGYFDVQHDPSRPFRVQSAGITTTVLGTAFNVKAYPGQDEVLVTVVRGKVQVADGGNMLTTLVPDQQLKVNTATHAYVRTRLPAETAVAWKKSFLILEDLSMAEVAERLESRYGVRIKFSNQGFANCRITATFLDGEALEQVLEVVTGVLNASYTISGAEVTLKGRGCNKN